MDHADAQNLAKPPFMRICREFENWRDLRALSGKFLRQKSCYPESFRFLRLCCLDVDGDGGYGGDWCYQFHNDVTLRCYQ